MISTVLALLAMTGPVQEPIDFQLGWKQGDKFAYTLLSTEGVGTSDKGRFDFTVTKADAKGFTISWPTAEMSGGAPDLRAGTLQLDKHGRVTSQGTLPFGGYFMTQMTLPEKPIALGGSFKYNTNLLGVKLDLNGKLAKIDETKGRVAHFSYEGTARSPDGIDLRIKISSVFDMVRGVFTSSVFEFVDIEKSIGFKLVENGKAAGGRTS